MGRLSRAANAGARRAYQRHDHSQRIQHIPQTFETKLTEHFNTKSDTTLVRQSALVGVWNADREDEDVILFVEWAHSETKTSDWLKETSLEICGHQVEPDYCFGLVQFPVTGGQNKLDKKALRDIARTQMGINA